MTVSKGFGRRIGIAGYVALLAMLRATPMSVAELAAASGLSRGNASRFVVTVRHCKWLRIAGWVMAEDSPCTPRFTFGKPERDTPMPELRPNGRPVHAPRMPTPTLKQLSPEVISLCNLLDEMGTPGSHAQLQERTGLSWPAADRALKALRVHRFARVAFWRTRAQAGMAPGGEPLPYYELSSGADAQRPEPKSRQLINLHYRLKKQNPVAGTRLLNQRFRALRLNASVFNLAAVDTTTTPEAAA